jgi:4'-phosphopantetheinyl transferase
MIEPPLADHCRLSPWCHPRDAGEVHVWSRFVDTADDLAGDLTLLDDAERAQAARFRFERDRRRYVRRHAFARRILACYLGTAPREVGFQRSVKGKPELHPRCEISFNMSQADDMTVVAVAQGRRVGVDVERVRTIDDAMGIADGLFAPWEVELLVSMPPATRSSAFLVLWTRKESLVKAMGGGLSIPLDSFSVLTQAADTSGRPVSRLGELPYAFAPLAVPAGYVGSATVAGSQITVRYMDAATGWWS